MNAWPQINFQKLVENVLNSQVDENGLTILGGSCAEQKLMCFLQRWEPKFPFRVWEYASEIFFEKEEAPPTNINVALLERGRLFGKDGDLTLRRNGSRFNWSFIGPTGIQAPKGDYDTKNYWSKDNKYKKEAFHQYQEQTLLWGKWDGKRRSESRVAAAKLNYPIIGERIQLDYKIFSHAGQVSFVWYTGLSEWKVTVHG